MKNIHLLPTDKPSRLCYDRDDNLLFAPNAGFTYGDGKQHLYITSDEKLPYDSSIFDSGAFYHRDPVGDVHIITKHTFKPNPHFCKRIILTTDQDLIKDGVQAIDDDFLQWFLKNPSCEFVEVSKICQKETISEWWGDLSDKEMEEVFKQTGNFRLGGWGHDIGPTEEDVKDMYLEVHNLDLKELNFNVYYKIIIPQEEPKQVDSETRQETLEEAALNIIPDRNIVGWVDSYSATERRGFIKGAKYQAERMYSHEQVLTILEQFIEHPTKPGYKRSDVVDFIKKFKQQDK
jgi:hypothetical protein